MDPKNPAPSCLRATPGAKRPPGFAKRSCGHLRNRHPALLEPLGEKFLLYPPVNFRGFQQEKIAERLAKIDSTGRTVKDEHFFGARNVSGKVHGRFGRFRYNRMFHIIEVLRVAVEEIR